MRKFFSSILKYDPKEYWFKRGKKFYNENIYEIKKYRKQEKKLLEYLSGLDFSTVFEIGCGYGRITRLIIDNFDIKEYLAIDISPHLIKKAKNLNSFKNLHFKVCDVAEINVEKKFDLVLGVETLMHVKSKDITSVIEKLVRVSKKHLVNVDWYQESAPIIRARHTFVHDYTKIYGKIPKVKKVNYQDLELSPQSYLFHVQIDDND